MLEYLGTDDSGWMIDIDLVPPESRVLLAGMGYDISFDEALLARKKCLIFGFDPHPASEKYLIEQQENNPALKSRYIFFPYAIHKASGRTIKSKFSKNVVAFNIHDPTNGGKPGKILTVGLQDLVDTLQPSLVKLNIEGSEYKAINGLTKLTVPQICIEFHHFMAPWTFDNTRQCMRRIDKLGYSLVYVRPREGDLYCTAVLFVRNDLAAQQGHQRIPLKSL